MRLAAGALCYVACFLGYIIGNDPQLLPGGTGSVASIRIQLGTQPTISKQWHRCPQRCWRLASQQQDCHQEQPSPQCKPAKWDWYSEQQDAICSSKPGGIPCNGWIQTHGKLHH